MSRGKLDTRVTIRSSVLIWAAELSSIVAVCGWERWQFWPIVHLSDCLFHMVLNRTMSSPRWRTWWGKWSHWWTWLHCRGEREGETGGSERTAGSTCGQNGDRVWTQQSGWECNKVWLTGSLGLSSEWCWAELACRHEWEPLWSEKGRHENKIWHETKVLQRNPFFTVVFTCWIRQYIHSDGTLSISRTGCRSRYVSCSSLLGLSPSTALMYLGSAW